MSNTSGEAAEQVVRMSLDGAEVAVRLAGTGAKKLAILLYSILKDQKKTRGKIRLTNLLRSGKELKVFAVMEDDLQTFCSEAKKYGVLYTVLKDRDSTDKFTDVMVRAEDASKINRIFERFHLTKVDMGSVKAQIEQAREEKAQAAEPKNAESAPAAEQPDDDLPPKPLTEQQKKDEFIEKLFPKKEPEAKASDPNREEGKTTKSPLSVPSSEKKLPIERSRSSDAEADRRPSVKKELEEIRKELEVQKAGQAKEIQKSPQHKAPPKKKRKKEKIK